MEMTAAEEIFADLRELTDPAERAALLDRACGKNSDLRAQVEALLRDADAAREFFGGTDANAALVQEGSPGEGPGSVIGRYKLIEPIGEGGMGVVYKAEQREPVARRVALKIIKLGLDTRGVIARFEAERQALALMDHPHIAKVLDAGTTPGGRPYFAMELVQGVPITEYCARQNLAVPDLLRLFLPVCHAVQHAHQKGVIHRDLKPSNILVTQNQGEPHPLVIDFGVAKATHQRLTEKTLFTTFGTLIGTPAYMSPEQAELGREDVDTRSDLYSLGVLLYELLTGTTPFPDQRLRSAGLGEMQRIIREEEPERPSSRLTRQANRQSPRPAAYSPSPAPSSHSVLDTDLDWIVMKCLEKDRSRRYETVNGLAADLKRHLANEPVTARPPGTAYRLQKALRRHRLAFASGAAVVLALVAGLVVSTWQAIRATRAEREQSVLRASARQAEQARTEELWRSLLTTARASRRSGTTGRRFDSLAAIRQATAIRPSLELRNEAIAALALTDLGPPEFGRDIPWSGEQPREADAAFDRDVRRVALNAQDGSIYVHRVDDHAELLRLPPSSDFAQGEAVRMVFSPDDRCLAVRAENGALRCWQLEPLQLTVDARLDAGFWNSLTFSSDSRFLLAGSADGALAGFPVDTDPASSSEPINEPAWRMNLGLRPWVIAFHPSNTRFAILWGNQAQVWRWPERERMQTMTLAMWGESLAWHPDGQHLWTVGENGTAQLWEISGPGQRMLRGPIEHLPQVSMHPRGDFVATYSYSGATRLWSISEDGPLLMTPDGLARTFSRDGRHLGFFHTSRRYGFWPVTTSRTYRSLAGASGSRSFGNLDFSPDGSVLIWCDSFGFWSLDLRHGGYRLYPSTGLTRAHFAGFGDTLIAGSGSGLKLHPIELNRSSGEAVVRWRGPAVPVPGGDFPVHGNCASVPFDRRQIVASEPLGRRLLWIDHEGSARALTSPCSPAVASASVSPDRRWLALGHYHGGTCILNASTEQVVHSWPELNTAHVGFTPDGEWLVTGTAEEYRFWRAGTWEPGHRIARGIQSGVASPLAFSPDGRTLATLKGLGTVQLHDVRTGETLATLESPAPQLVHYLSFSPQGNVLAVIGISAVQLWDLAEIRRELEVLGLDWHHPPISRTDVSLGDVGFRYLVDSK